MAVGVESPELGLAARALAVVRGEGVGVDRGVAARRARVAARDEALSYNFV